MKKAVSILLVFQLLLSSIGLASNAHYCGGQIVETSLTLGINNDGCGMKAEKTPCHNQKERNNASFNKKCCDNVHQSLKVEQQSKVEIQSLKFQTFFVAFLNVFVLKLISNSFSSSSFINDDPPLLKSPFRVLFQVFRI
jgi:hypothetical protein